MGGKAVLLAKQTEFGDDMMVSRYPDCLEHSVNSTRKDMREGIREQLDSDMDVNDTEGMEDETETCVGGKLTRERQLRAMREELVAEVDEVDKDNIIEDIEVDEVDIDMDNIKEEEGGSFLLVDKRANALLQPWEFCQHKIVLIVLSIPQNSGLRDQIRLRVSEQPNMTAVF